jgi:uncharacterized protein
MPKVVVDANIVVSAALKAESLPEQVILLARAHDTICLSPAVVEEMRCVMARPKFSAAISEARREQLLELLGAAAQLVTPGEAINDCRDRKDNKYLELALEAGAEVIVSGDPDLLILDPWRGVRILRPADYVARVRARRPNEFEGS